MREPRKIEARRLGIYLVILAVVEVILCFWHGAPFIVRPRVGLSYVLAGLKAPERQLVPLAELTSASWLLLLGIAFLSAYRPIKIYIVSEILLALPTILFVGSLTILGGGHVLRRADAALPLVAVVLFTAVPLGWAVFALRSVSNRSTT